MTAMQSRLLSGTLSIQHAPVPSQAAPWAPNSQRCTVCHTSVRGGRLSVDGLLDSLFSATSSA